MRRGDVARGLAGAALAGPWDVGGIAARFASALATDEARWMRGLARSLVRAYPDPPIDIEALARWVAAQRALCAARERDLSLAVRRWLVPEPRMGARPFDVPEVCDVIELASLLSVPLEHLDWLCDVRGMNRGAHDPRLRHYRCRWIAKRSGGRRLLEAPKPELRRAQRALLDRVLARIPPHPAACGFVAGRSVLDHARAHTGRRIVIRLDLASFFWSIAAGRVRGVFRAAGYPPEVAARMSGLATTRTPHAILAELPHPIDEREAEERFELRRRLAHRHLPQGAPSSPALANLCAFGLDRRLSGLARRFDAAYTRYADDLAFSGDVTLERDLERFLPRAGAIVIEEGFALQYRKTRVMRAGGRQELSGVVVNERTSITRRELERLEAILVNCARHGPSSQNRLGHPDFRAHLAGKLAWIAQVAPHQSIKLRAIYDRITWDRDSAIIL